MEIDEQPLKVSAVPDDERTDEVQTIIDRMPTTGATYAAILTALLVVFVLILGCLIKYPDTVDGTISITARYAPVRLVSNTDGRVHLIKMNNAKIAQGDILSYIDNAAFFEDVALADSLLQEYAPEHAVRMNLPAGLNLGEISPAYNEFILAHKQYVRFMQSNTYTTQRRNRSSQLSIDSLILSQIKEELGLKQEVISLSALQGKKDSLMYYSKAITEAELIKRHSDRLSLLASYQSLKSNQSTALSRINTGKIELVQLEIEEQESRSKLVSQLIAAQNSLTGGIALWKQKYVVTSPIDGTLEYLGFWRENSFVRSGDALYSVMPDKNEIVGEVVIPAFGAGKVELGQPVNVKLHNFPYDEFGTIQGEVSSISQLTSITQTKDGNVETYQVTVLFPNGSLTNYGERLNLNFETKGTAEIITKDKKLIARLFDNLKYSVSK